VWGGGEKLFPAHNVYRLVKMSKMSKMSKMITRNQGKVRSFNCKGYRMDKKKERGKTWFALQGEKM
ncbi:MAG: hypothetical protein D3914_14620, partial [Candidatus Electrothrix sp. LOE2]|nr:hypothetical protein [Candidatus Electrothrix sp. LOE2]